MPFGLGRTTVGVGIGVLLVLLLAGGYGVSQTVGGDDDPEPTATAEPEESAVLCEPEDSEDGDDGASVETPAVPADSSFGGRELFFQNDARWGNIEYDHATSLAGGTDWCGNTIAGCGCAMTSVANILSLFGVLATPDGQELNPQAFDNWLGRDAQFVGNGFISPGYYYGDVVWTDIQAFTAALRRDDPSIPLVRYRGVGNGSEAELFDEISAGRLVVLELKGHFIAAIGIEDGQVRIHDPFYPDRRFYSEVEQFVVSSRLFEFVSGDSTLNVSGILIMADQDTKIMITDEDGNEAGTLDPTIIANDVASGAATDVPNSVVRFESQWRDPTCINRAPEPDAGNISIFVPLAEPGRYTVEAVHPGSETCFAVYRYDREGNVQVEVRCGTSESTIDIEYTPEPEPEATPTPTVTVTSTPEATATETETPEPTATTPPTTTPTPASAPDVGSLGCTPSPQVAVGQLVTCRPVISGTTTSLSWTAPGGGPSAGSSLLFSTSFSAPGSRSIQLEACNGSACDTGTALLTVLAPADATFSCTPTSAAIGQPVTCTAATSGAASYSWLAAGGDPSSGGVQIFETHYSSAGTKTIQLEVCNAVECDTQTRTVSIQQPLSVDISCSATRVSVGQSVVCSAVVLSGGPIATYNWQAQDQAQPSPGDANPASGTQSGFVTAFSFGGTKLITLGACDASNSCDAAFFTIFVDFFDESSLGRLAKETPTLP